MAFGLFGSRAHTSTASVLLEPAAALLPVQIHIENTLVRFTTHFTLRNNGAVLLHKPSGVDALLVQGVYVRLSIVEADWRDLRLRVTVPHLELKSGRAAFLCRPCEDFAPSRRKEDRHAVLRYRNLRLHVGGHVYRMADLSGGGLRIILGALQSSAHLPVGRRLADARLDLGKGSAVTLASVIPRNHYGRMVGCAIQVAAEPESLRCFEHVLDAARRAEAVDVGG